MSRVLQDRTLPPSNHLLCLGFKKDVSRLAHWFQEAEDGHMR